MIEKHLELLGIKVKDRVTGFEGVVVHVGFDLYGCIQAIVHPGVADDGKLKDTCWFDVARLDKVSDEPVMIRPDYLHSAEAISKARKGPSERPTQNKH